MRKTLLALLAAVLFFGSMADAQQIYSSASGAVSSALFGYVSAKYSCPAIAGDGVTDDSTAIQNCVDANKGRRLVFDSSQTFSAAHTYLSGATYNNTKLSFSGLYKLKASGGATNYQGAWVGIIVEAADGVEITGNFDGNFSNQTASEFHYNIAIAGATNWSIHDVTIKNIMGDGIYLAGQSWTAAPTQNCNGGNISNVVMSNPAINGRNALSIISCENLNISGFVSKNVGGNIGGIIMPGGIDIEPNFGWERVQNVSMSGINITCGGSSCLAVQGVGKYFTVNTTSGSAALTSASSTADVYPGDIITCADGSGIPAGGATIFSVVGSTINLNPGETATATATGTHCNTAPTTKGVAISGATVINNAPADTLDQQSNLTLAGARTFFIKDAADVQLTGFNGTCGAAGVNCQPIIIKNADHVSINATGVRNCETCFTLASNTDVDGTTGGVTNSDITIDCADVARSCGRIWRVANVKIGGGAEHPRAASGASSYYPGGLFAYWMDSNTLNNVTFNVRIPYSPNWTIGFQGGATLNNVRVVNSSFGSGWSLGTLRATFNSAVNIPFINSAGFTDVAAPPAASTCGTGAAVDATSNSWSGKFTTGTGGTSCTLTFSTSQVGWVGTARCTVTPMAAVTAVGEIPYVSAQSNTAFTVTNTKAATAYQYTCRDGG